MLSVQAVLGHADLVVQPLQPELYETRVLPALIPKGRLRAGTLPRNISTQMFHPSTKPGIVPEIHFLKPELST